MFPGVANFNTYFLSGWLIAHNSGWQIELHQRLLPAESGMEGTRVCPHAYTYDLIGCRKNADGNDARGVFENGHC